MWFLLLNRVSLAGFAQSRPYTSPPGDPERKVIMDALRTPVERALRKRVIFKVDLLKVQAGWAFMRGAPLRSDSSPMDYRGTPYRQLIDDGMFDDWICALFHWRGGKWEVVQYVIGATDVVYADWSRRFGAPPGIFR
ncbi:MAG: hypothetical protein JNK95_07570 [Candidatus Competibacter sp.]|nr:hypothetical protein [Candidatus Competibacter sp.]MDG4605698.1 hypothetical protein [Candidatus Contendobacter sp.]HRD49671.1 hypothetical protein [Candidatus Contendobacter sp.]